MGRALLTAVLVCVTVLAGSTQAYITLSYCFGDGVNGINGRGDYQISSLATGVVVALYCQPTAGGPPIGQVQDGYGGGGSP